MIDEDELSCVGQVFSSILGIYTIVEDPGGTDSLRTVTVMWGRRRNIKIHVFSLS